MEQEENDSVLWKIVGEVYSTEGLSRLWEVTPAEAKKLAERTGLLVVTVSDSDEEFYPVFQFDGKSARADVLRVLARFKQARIEEGRDTPESTWEDVLWLHGGREEKYYYRYPTMMAALDAGDEEYVMNEVQDTLARRNGSI